MQGTLTTLVMAISRGSSLLWACSGLAVLCICLAPMTHGVEHLFLGLLTILRGPWLGDVREWLSSQRNSAWAFPKPISGTWSLQNSGDRD